MTTKPYSCSTRQTSAFSLIEVLVTIVLLLIVATGIWRFRYEATLHAERAQQITAAGRVANLICQSWKAVNGVNTYNPTQCNFDSSIVLAATSTTSLTTNNLNGFTSLGQWTVQTPDAPYAAALFYQDDISVPGLRTLRVLLEWKDRRNLSHTVQLCTLANDI